MNTLPAILGELEKKYGVPQWRRKDPLDELMVTLLSQNTNDKNRDQGYKRLRDKLPTWEAVLSAKVSEIEEAIRPAGLSRQKSTRMKDILKWVESQFGALDLSRLSEYTNTEAITLLTSRKGIGVKTAAVVLAFAFDRDICPVDTHVHRISKRLGWIKSALNAEKTFVKLQHQIPQGKAATFHLNLLKFGRDICTARNPKCKECFVWDRCSWDAKLPR